MAIFFLNINLMTFNKALQGISRLLIGHPVYKCCIESRYEITVKYTQKVFFYFLSIYKKNVSPIMPSHDDDQQFFMMQYDIYLT